MYTPITTLINKVHFIDRRIMIINKRLTDIDFNLSEIERNPILASYSRVLLHESNLLWEEKIALIDQKNNLMKMINDQKYGEEMAAELMVECFPELYELIHTNVSGISILFSVKRSGEREDNYIGNMNEEEKIMRKQQIDSRVKRLEKVNDEWMAKHGEANEGIISLINDLMDERETLK